ncbi:MAG: hypothetical protein HY332_24125 [Chloroflexi bacterium]|nr:hypothetical protein [Chloroflexota bacterium]
MVSTSTNSMLNIIFRWTTPALLAGAQSSTRQAWSPRTARQYRAGQLVAAYDTSPRAGGRPVALLRLTADPAQEPLRSMTEADYDAEGWRWLYEHPEALASSRFGYARREDFSPLAFEQWRNRPFSVWVIRFEVIARADPSTIAARPQAKYATPATWHLTEPAEQQHDIAAQAA